MALPIITADQRLAEPRGIKGTIFGSGALVMDNDFHHPGENWSWNTDCTKNARPVVIGRGVFVGARAIILKGVTIGDRAVIGAGAVVVRDVPAGMVAAGNPARILGPHQATPPAAVVK